MEKYYIACDPATGASPLMKGIVATMIAAGKHTVIVIDQGGSYRRLADMLGVGYQSPRKFEGITAPNKGEAQFYDFDEIKREAQEKDRHCQTLKNIILAASNPYVVVDEAWALPRWFLEWLANECCSSVVIKFMRMEDEALAEYLRGAYFREMQAPLQHEHAARRMKAGAVMPAADLAGKQDSRNCGM